MITSSYRLKTSSEVSHGFSEDVQYKGCGVCYMRKSNGANTRKKENLTKGAVIKCTSLGKLQIHKEHDLLYFFGFRITFIFKFYQPCKYSSAVSHQVWVLPHVLTSTQCLLFSTSCVFPVSLPDRDLSWSQCAETFCSNLVLTSSWNPPTPQTDWT